MTPPKLLLMKKCLCTFTFQKKKKYVPRGRTSPKTKKKPLSWLMTGLFKRRGIRLADSSRLCLPSRQGVSPRLSYDASVRVDRSNTGQANGSYVSELVLAGSIVLRHCKEWMLVFWVTLFLYLLFLSFVVLSFWLLPFLHVFFSILFLLKWLLYTALSWSLSEIDVVPSTYPWVFKAMTLITKVSLC